MGIALNKFYPSKELRPYIRFYYTISSEEKNRDVRLDNHPQGCIDMIFALQGGVKFNNDKTGRSPLQEVFLIGQQEQRFDIAFGPMLRVLGITFTAEGFNKIFRLPVSQLTNVGLEARDLLGKDDFFLLEKIVEAADLEAQLQLMNDFFCRRIYENDLPFDAVDAAIRKIRQAGGQLSIQDVADTHNMSVRTLQRKFSQKTGVSPKTYARIMRFNSVLTLLQHAPGADWHDILYRCGYYDQMHFIKEFKHYTGFSPTEFVKKGNMLGEFFLED